MGQVTITTEEYLELLKDKSELKKNILDDLVTQEPIMVLFEGRFQSMKIYDKETAELMLTTALQNTDDMLNKAKSEITDLRKINMLLTIDRQEFKKSFWYKLFKLTQCKMQE